MHLPRHTIESHAAVPLFHLASFCSLDPSVYARTSAVSNQDNPDQLSQPAVFSCASLNGFLVAQTDPLKLVANRTWTSSQGGLSHAVPVQHTSLLFLVGGGRVPRFAPNKVILWDEAAEYTAKNSAGTSHDPDSDDDDLSFVASRRASTIFSAGSEFDAYGRHRQDSLDCVAQLGRSAEQQSPSFSPVNSLRFSTSSLVSSDDLRQDDDGEGGPSANAGGGGGHDANDEAMENSIGASSLGIGRLQASHLSETSDRSGAASPLLEDESSDMSASSYSRSIMASSANLADPFAEDDMHSPQSSSPTAMLQALRSPSDSSIRRPMPSSPPIGRRSAETAHVASSHQGLFSSQSPRPPGAGLVDSVSSMATTATDATAKAPPKILRGREVAELEFSEVVRGIYATSIHLGRPDRKRDGGKGKGRASTDTAYAKNTDAHRICVVLVVLLASKAVVFELSPPSTNLGLEGRKASPTWMVRKRAAVQTFKNPKGLASVAPYYPENVDSNAQPSAIVAVLGRQKGHVQLLRLKLQSASSDDAMPVLSNAISSVGAASIIVAHDSSLAAITLSPNGRLLATASSKGTLIRVWSNDLSGGSRSGGDRASGSHASAKSHAPGRTGFGTKLIRELRRGTDPATILSIAFAPDASLIAAASDKGTIHIFLLANTAAAPTQTNAGEQGRSSPTSTSRASHLGRAAAQYLPTGIGNLAGQIPPSVLPQYLKSEWSSAQYRIPLRSFGASSRHYSSAPTTDDNGMYSGGGTGGSGAPAGTEKSTEGAWAQMRSRISDIRKGEANVDEKVSLCWIIEGTASNSPAASTAGKGAKSVNQQGRADKPKTRGPTTSVEPRSPHTAQKDARQRYRLIAVTTSGGWYKLAITLPRPAVPDDEVSGSTVLDMYRSDASIQSKSSKSDKDNVMECKLVEFRPIVALLDGWRA